MTEILSPSMAQIDVRPIPPRERHARVFAAFEHLPVGGSLELISDHEPQPLKAQFQAQWSGQFAWEVVENGPMQWITRISRGPAKTCCGCCGG